MQNVLMCNTLVIKCFISMPVLKCYWPGNVLQYYYSISRTATQFASTTTFLVLCADGLMASLRVRRLLPRYALCSVSSHISETIEDLFS